MPPEAGDTEVPPIPGVAGEADGCEGGRELTCGEVEINATNAATLNQITGYKDDKKVEVEFPREVEAWHPNFRDVLKMIELFYEAEDFAFPDGYGRQYLWWLMTLIAMDSEKATDDAFACAEMEGWPALRFFEDTLETHGTEAISSLDELMLEAKENG